MIDNMMGSRVGETGSCFALWSLWDIKEFNQGGFYDLQASMRITGSHPDVNNFLKGVNSMPRVDWNLGTQCPRSDWTGGTPVQITKGTQPKPEPPKK